MAFKLEGLRDEYARLLATMVVRREKAEALKWAVQRVMRGRERYQALWAVLGIPWEFIGVWHLMECNGSFSKHLHNGDPLTGRTVRVPAGRPKTGSPPFAWEASAIDALEMKGLGPKTDWTSEGMLYQLERNNGFGYRIKHPEVLSPYLWGGTNHYERGKYVRDGVWDPEAVSAQLGAAAVLRALGRV